MSDGELRRLAPAADFERTLVGVHAEGEGSPYIWGLASSGVQWLRRLQSGWLDGDSQLPDALVLHVMAPGHVLMARGGRPLVELRGGELSESGLDVFLSEWMPRLFAPVRAEVIQITGDAPGATTTRPTVSDDVVRAVAQPLMRRTLWAIRRARHGGTLISVPSDDAGDLVVPGVTMKYGFVDQDTRRRFRQLILSMVSTLQDDAERLGVPHVDWTFYRERLDVELRALEEAVMELAQLMASLAAVD